MEVTEVEIFILKFKQLWKADLSAHRILDAQAGEEKLRKLLKKVKL